MVLLQPILLTLTVAVGAALIVAYYFQRRKAPRVPFSAVCFLPPSSPARTAQAALPPLRLLIPITIAALAFLSLAQPMVSRSQPAPLGMIVDDRAFAAGKGNRALVELAVSVAEKMPSSAHWGVLTTSGQAVAFGAGGESLVSLLNSYSIPISQPSCSPSVFEETVKSLKDRTSASPVLVLIGNTDTLFECSGLDSLRGELEKKGVTLLTVLDKGSSKPAFIATTEMPHLAKLGSEVRARVGIANTSSDSLSGELRLAAGDDVILRAPVRLPAQSLKWQELRLSPQNKGLTKYEIALTLGGEETIEDIVSWELVAFTKQQVVVLASASNATPGYIEKALRASPLVDKVTVVEPESLDADKMRQLLSSTRVVVLDGVDSSLLPIDLGVQLKSWVESGGVLVFSAGTKVTEVWNKNVLSIVFPAAIKLKKNKMLEGMKVAEHPITRDLELETTPLTVSQWVSLDKYSQEQVILRVGGEPMLLLKKAKEGTVLVWASTSDPRWNNWARYPSFPVFWSNVVEYAVSGDVRSGSERRDNTRRLWRAPAAPALNDKVYFIDANDGGSVALPSALQGALDKPSKGYRDYRTAFVAASVVLALGYLWLESPRKRRVSR